MSKDILNEKIINSLNLEDFEKFYGRRKGLGSNGPLPPSSEFEKRMRKLYCDMPKGFAPLDILDDSGILADLDQNENMLAEWAQKGAHRKAKRVAVTAAILALIATTSIPIISNADLGDIVRFLTRVFERFGVIQTEQPDYNTENWNIDPNYGVSRSHSNLFLPEWVPGGYAADKINATAEGEIYIRYSSGTHDINFYQSSHAGLYNEEYEFKESVTTDGIEYSIGENSVNNEIWRSVTWTDGETYFNIFGIVNKDELLKMAQSIKFKE